MSDWTSESTEPGAWYEHEVDEADYPRPQQQQQHSHQSQAQQQHTHSTWHHSSQHQHNYRDSRDHYSRHSQSVRDERDTRNDRIGDRNERGDVRERNDRGYQQREYRGRGNDRYDHRDHHRDYDDRRNDRYRGDHRTDRYDRDSRPPRDDRDHHHHHHHQHDHYHRSHDFAPQHHHQADEEEYDEEPDVEETVSDEDDSEDASCPLCMESLDATDKQFKPCKCGYQVCLWCFPAGTPITLANGMTQSIESFEKGELILSVDVAETGVNQSESATLVHARSHALLPQGSKPLVSITTEDGESIRCTADHRLLVTDSRTGHMRWTEAQLIDLEHDRLRVSIRGPQVEPTEQTEWTFSSTGLESFDLTNHANTQRALTLARVCGFATFQCAKSDSLTHSIHAASSFDAIALREDIRILTGQSHHDCADVNNVEIQLPESIARLVAPHTLPTFLSAPECSRMVKREFIAGYIGAALVSDPSPAAPVLPAGSGIGFDQLSEEHLHVLQPLVEQFTSITMSHTMTPTQAIAFASAIGVRYHHQAATRLALAVAFWRINTDKSLDSFLTRCDGHAAFNGDMRSFSLRVIDRSLVAGPAQPVFDLMVADAKKSSSVHSFIAGSVAAHNCFHHINENLGGKCPACRRTYDTTGQMAADPTVLDTIAAKAASGGVRRGRAVGAGAGTVSRDRKVASTVPLAHVRVLQRNLLYVVGLPVALAKDDLLKSKSYFGKFGKIVKIALGLKGGPPIAGDRKQTCSCYVTYKRGVDAVEAIRAVNGCILSGCLLKATYGTSKYCANWLRQAPCNNPSCLYLHETADPKDCTTKDELSIFLQETQPSTINPQAIALNGLPGATANSSMIPGSAAMAPLIPMTRQNSLGNSGADRDDQPEDDQPQPDRFVAPSPSPPPPASAGNTPAPATTPAPPVTPAAPSSWASLAGSRGGDTKQPGVAIPAVTEPPPAEVLMPNEIIYIAPPHLRGTSGARKMGSRTSSNASGVDPKKSDELSAPNSPFESPLNGEASVHSPSTPSSTTNLIAPSLAPLAQQSLSPVVGPDPVLSPALPAAVLLPSQSPLGSLVAQSGPIAPSQPNPPPTSSVGSRPPPGFFAPKHLTMPSIAPPAISQLQAPPGSGPIAKLGPLPGQPAPATNGLTGPPPMGQPGSQPPSQQAPASPAVSLQKLVSAFPALDPQILALLSQVAPFGLPPLNNHMMHTQQQQQPGGLHSNPSSHHSLSHSTSPSNGSHFPGGDAAHMDPAILSFSSRGPPPGVNVDAAPSSTGPPPGGFFQNFGGPSTGFGSGLSPQRLAHQQQQQQSQQPPLMQNHDRMDRSVGGFHSQQSGPADWESLADDDTGSSRPSSLNHWSSWGKALEADEMKQRQVAHPEGHQQHMLRDQHHHQQQQHMLRDRDPSRGWGNPPPSSSGWPHDNSLSLNSTMHPNPPPSSSTTPTSRYGFALEEDDDRAGDMSTGVAALRPSSFLHNQPPPQQQRADQWKQVGPPGLGGLGGFGQPNNNPSNGWPQSSQPPPGMAHLAPDRDLVMMGRDRPQPPQPQPGGWPTREHEEYGSLSSFGQHEFGAPPPQSNIPQQRAQRAPLPHRR